ncbi:MAG: hypothetical protein CO158_07920 [Piscirickettsiaceae bacterium CG_4_9_14_3_um_filter_43_564]|nr:MAG: hypothetical protein COW74_00460 [Piscirickettsiaceae bacterium CG18_big_fil_WC_8_21_14_2_50_44_103]PIU37854.1 MAG: hypothetical protein COT01_09775 [Piscirickettsiaceae bacterium CG07_land_8_20_14_0_80_44_28]PIW57226.1 MAG: hypothetical protein COW14_07295 [Piscirickettsiaceae bacterium CG12_big_fil_rev_8_21_14_0_65_44_934]PIW77922.1 MAG: hypothetical protein CO000_04285 [Piscirickettsiaceae bacterium CG_4_8_14_3_um_filter_44_38]PIX80764.1 MAG: hypothetical protein COZ36_01465 [Pisciri
MMTTPFTLSLFKTLRVISLLLSPLLLGSCSSIQVSQDYDATAHFNDIKTVQWLDDADQVEPKAATFAAKNPLIAKRIHQAITIELPQKGITFVDQNPTGYVTYHLETFSKKRGSQVTTSFGFGSFGRYGGFGFQTYPDGDYYDQEKLVIDLFNAEKKLIWRGISTRYIEEHLAPEELTQRIQEGVKKLLEQYPPNAAKP